MAAVTLPLTTTFSAPSSCFSTITARDGALILGDSSDCIPQGAQVSERTYAFSPALSCPMSYSTAMRSFTIIGITTEFRAICCPVLDGIPDIATHSLYYNFMTTDVSHFATLGCTMDWIWLSGFPVMVNGTSTSTTLSQRGGINAYSVQIAWQASDLSTLSIASAASSTTTTSNSSHSTPIPPTSNNLPPISTAPLSPTVLESSDLSIGPKIAIAILSPLAAISILLAAILLVKYRRRKALYKHQKRPNDPGQHIPDSIGIYIGDTDTEPRQMMQG